MSEQTTREQQAHLALVGKPTAPKIDSLERPSYAVYEGPTMVESKQYRAGT